MDVVGVLLPRRCAVCRSLGASVCDGCLDALVRIAAPVCERCGAPGAWPVRRCAECIGRRLAFATARGALVYDDRARILVGAWKERARRDLTTVAADLVAATLPAPRVDVITFVPGDRDRGLRRGHTPAELLAAELAVRWDVPARRLLHRRPGSTRQRDLPRARRRANVVGAFSVRRLGVPARVCLVDDVYTTGATVAACATELRRSGARRVDVVCLARAVR